MYKWGGLGQLGVTRGHLQCHHSIERIRLPILDFNRNHASILYRFRPIASYLSKVADFDPPHLHLAPPPGVAPVEFRGDLWHQKTTVPGLSCGFICVILCLAVLVEHRLLTDTDTQGRRQVKICGVDTDGERGARAYSGGLGTEPPRGPGAEPLIRGAKSP